MYIFLGEAAVLLHNTCDERENVEKLKEKQVFIGTTSTILKVIKDIDISHVTTLMIDNLDKFEGLVDLEKVYIISFAHKF